MSAESATVVLLISAFATLGCGGLVLKRHPRRLTHRVFTLLTFNLALWTLATLFFIRFETRETALYWSILGALAGGFLPVTFYYFVALFPRQRFEGSLPLLCILFAGVPVFVAVRYTFWGTSGLILPPENASGAVPGPAFYLYHSAWAAVIILATVANLVRKMREATGIDRRQIEHVLIGISLTALFVTATNILTPMGDLAPLAVYGPVSTLCVVGFMAYALLQYHLLDVPALLSRTTLYALLTTFVVMAFWGTVFVVSWVFRGWGTIQQVLEPVLAALVIVLLLQPTKERLQLLLDRRLLKRRYDTSRMLGRISAYVAQLADLDRLLKAVMGDIQETVGAQKAWVMLRGGRDPGVLVTEYSTVPGDTGSASAAYGALIEYLETHPEPIVLEKILYDPPTENLMTVARLLAEMDAYLCVPLRMTSGLAGLLALGAKTGGDIYSADDIALFEAVAGPLAAAIENARLHRELEETTQNLERILASMQGGVIAVDADGKVTNANSAATRLLGPIATGRDFHALPTEVAWVLDSTFKRGRGVTGFETAIAGPEGDRIPVAISSALLKNAQMETAGAMVLITDLSEIKRLEQHVHRADRLSSIGTLAAGMAHEIKNPLMSIKTFMQLLPTSYEDKDFRDTMSELVPREVDRINALVGRLLDFAAPKPVKPAVHDMRAVLDHVLALLDLQLRKVNVQVERDYPETEALVRADDQQLYQIFLNLILNAVEAMSGQDQGVLSIGIKAVPRLLRRDLFSPPVETPCIQVAVRDTGCGIPEKDKEHIFTPFFTKKPSGCGLGLAVVHGMVTEMGGEIDVSSVVGAGTTFTAALPVAEPDSAIENDLLSKQEEGDGR